jgi:hypothetical protein
MPISERFSKSIVAFTLCWNPKEVWIHDWSGSSLSQNRP